MTLSREDVVAAVRAWLDEHGFGSIEYANKYEYPNLIMNHSDKKVGIQIVDIEDADQPKKAIIDGFAYIEKGSSAVDSCWLILASIGKEITDEREELADKYIEQYEVDDAYELTYGCIDSDYKFNG
ncbi:MAG: hypothetical protein AAF518_16025 [Spirochaetota bacterium]